MPKKQTEKTDTFQKQLPVRLTDEELRHRGDELASQLDLMDEIDARITAAKEAAKGPRQQTQERIFELRDQLRRKAEDRLVDCEMIKRFDQRCAETVRLDTGEIVGTRPLTAQEMQTKLAIVKDLKPGQAPARPKVP